MRMTLSIITMMAVLAATAFSAPPMEPSNRISFLAKTASIDNRHYIDVNKILMFVTNHGNFGRDIAGVFDYGYGTWFPYYGDTTDIRDNLNSAGDHSPLYAAGLWIGAVDSATGDVRVVISSLSSEYTPGMMDNGASMPDRPEFRIYTLHSDSLADNPNFDYVNWAVVWGAPVDEFGDPEMIGDQMLWAIYNDANALRHTNDAGGTAPLGLEVKQTAYAFDGAEPLDRIIFLRWRIYNRGENTLKDCIVSLWIDPDIGGPNDDLAACDTLRSLGYAFNGDDDDSQYGITPPCLGIRFLQTPLTQTGNPADTGRMWGLLWPGHRNPPMATFVKYTGGVDPEDSLQTYNYMRGLLRDGQPYVFDDDTLTYFASGDPVTGTGDLDISPADRRFLMSTGPIDCRPGDSTEIMAAVLVGQGITKESTIAEMRNIADYARTHYIQSFDGTVDASQPDSRAIPRDYHLSQNYPNPFNPSTTINFNLGRGGHTVIEIFDVLGRKVTTLLDGPLRAGAHAVTWDGADAEGQDAATGIYFYRFRAGDAVEVKKMILMK